MTIECVPNFSEGRDRSVIDALEQAVRSTGIPLLDSTSDPDHNRTVLTFAGEPGRVVDAALAAVRVARDRIDLRTHTGVHPRIGAADVVPFVPIQGATLDDCHAIARDAGNRIWSELGIPVYFYGARPLEDVRRLSTPPDLGKDAHPTAGYCAVGARKFLIAWNIELNSNDLNAAREIARAIRESNGGLKKVKALGLALPSKNRVQVSINLVDFEVTPLHVVFEAVQALCKNVAGSELIGLIPQAALDGSAGHDLHWLNMRPELVLENALRRST